ncbi:hypothetical protein QOZ80_6AG0527050 [Eleusine coracana subsp. coracana]|nr:hypothetical protein QOZ80_6AG0527050 [Eleusine coracana subsp. coracana]
MNKSIVIYTAYVHTVDELTMSFTISDNTSPVHYVLSYSGKFMILSWDRDSADWIVVGISPEHECSKYGYCGPSGYCDSTNATPTCECLDGFEPVDKGEWSSGRFSQGCRRKQPLRCSDGFLALPGMKVPDKFVRIGNKTIEECEANCRINCSCVAYAYAILNGSISKGDVTRCLVWIDDHLLDMSKYNLSALGTETLYLRVAGLSSGDRKKQNRVKIIIAILASAVVVFCILLLWLCKFRGKKRNVKHPQNRHSALATSDEQEENVILDLDFPFLKFQDILVSTNNFSKTSMIGQGGFGKVYRGTLEGGQEVAIKRLSRDSQQGIEEFRNEVILIAKLQHRNLVRLLGCCVDGDEKLLIYEYLPNRSLDAFIFNSARNATLDWTVRFNIIKGIARGLLYLHRDSRLTIIHRDLKASNVLLDAAMGPKIADFGMARIFGDNQKNTNTKRVVGTYGYMAPEYAMEGIFSVKSDVYSFGVLLLEVVSGIKISSVDRIMDHQNLIVYAWNLWKEGKATDLVDRCVVENCLLDEASFCIHVGLLCVRENPDDKPLMSSVVFNLENGCTILPMPNHPAYFAPRNNEIEQIGDDIMKSKNAITLTAIEGR